MRRFGFTLLTRFALAAIAGVALFSASEAKAQSTFLTFSSTAPTNQFTYSNSTGVLTGSETISFTISNIAGYALDGVTQTGVLTYTAMAYDTVLSSRSGVQQDLYATTFSITQGTTNVLGVTSADGSFAGSGTTGAITDSSGAVRAPGSPQVGGPEVTFTSDFLNFTNASTLGYSLSVGNIIPGLTVGGNGNFNDFSAGIGGQFSSTPVPTVVGTPEPASVAMLGLGLAGVFGFGVIRRRKMSA